MSSNHNFDTSKVSSASAQTNQTQQQQGTNSSGLNANTLAPSQMRDHIGPPEVAHDYPEDSTHRRHSTVTAQQAHFMK